MRQLHLLLVRLDNRRTNTKFYTPSGQTVRPGEKGKVIINVKERGGSRR